MGRDFLQCVVNLLEKDLGKCGPLSMVVDGVLTSTCDKIIKPIVSYAIFDAFTILKIFYIKNLWKLLFFVLFFFGIIVMLFFQNGFWFGVFWSLILFIPTIILSVKLSSLYKKFKQYPGHIHES